jgi:DNA-binding GntR family transcriptional regulator
MDGTLAPGTPLREVGLAKEFDVSRRTVQEALATLGTERLVQHRRHRGARVAQLTGRDIEDLYMIRLELELMAARRAAQASEESRSELERAYEELRIATASGLADEIVARDLAFHQAVVGLLDSPRIDVFFKTIASELRYALSILESYMQETSKRPRDALREHVEIRDALLAGDSRLATKRIGEHVESYRNRLVSALAEDEGGEGSAGGGAGRTAGAAVAGPRR